jgi:hypothetical protein
MATDVLSGYLNENVKITKLQDHTTAGTTTITSDELDMLGYDGVLFLTSYGTAATNNIATMTQGATGAEAATVALVTSGTSDEDIVLDVAPDAAVGRYVKLSCARGTSSTLESIWAIQYRGRNRPVVNALSGTIVVAQFNGPALA